MFTAVSSVPRTGPGTKQALNKNVLNERMSEISRPSPQHPLDYTILLPKPMGPWSTHISKYFPCSYHMPGMMLGGYLGRGDVSMRTLSEAGCKNSTETSLDIKSCVGGGGDSLFHITGKFKGNAYRNYWNQEHKKKAIWILLLCPSLKVLLFPCTGLTLGQDFFRL